MILPEAMRRPSTHLYHPELHHSTEDLQTDLFVHVFALVKELGGHPQTPQQVEHAQEMGTWYCPQLGHGQGPEQDCWLHLGILSEDLLITEEAEPP